MANNVSNGVLKINPNDYYICKVFELPREDFRDAVVNYMRKMAAVEWECSENFGMEVKWEHWGVDLAYRKGEIYRGMPYTGLIVSLDQFKELIVDGKYTTDQKDWKKSPGVNCFTAVMHSTQQVECTCLLTWDIFPHEYENPPMKLVGEYTLIEDAGSTHQVTELNGIDVMCKAYAQLQKGDVIGWKNHPKGYNFTHYRIITEEPIIVRDENGKIDPEKSTVKCIEQTNKFDTDRTDGVKTTWRIDKAYTLQSLFDKSYLPVTLYNYEKPRDEVELPYICLEKEIKAEELEKRTFGDNAVRSNFPIRYVRIRVYNQEGEEVLSKTKGDMARTFEVNLEEEFAESVASLEKGKYTLKLDGGLARGNVDFAKVEFEIK